MGKVCWVVGIAGSPLVASGSTSQDGLGESWGRVRSHGDQGLGPNLASRRFLAKCLADDRCIAVGWFSAGWVELVSSTLDLLVTWTWSLHFPDTWMTRNQLILPRGGVHARELFFFLQANGTGDVRNNFWGL